MSGFELKRFRLAGASSAVSRAFAEKMGERVSPLDFGAKGDGTTIDDAAFAAVIAYAQALARPVQIWLGSLTYRLTAALTINPGRVQLVGESATLDFSGLASGSAIWIRGVGTAGEIPAGNSARQTIAGVKLVGNAALTLVDVYSDSGTSDSREIGLDRVVFKTAAVGVRLSKNGWKLQVSRFAFEDCAVGVDEVQDNSGGGILNFGENNNFTAGLFAGTGIAFRSRNYSSDAHFHRVSFDTPQAFDLAHGARAFVVGGHFEPGTDTAPVAVVEGDSGGLAQTLLSIKQSLLVLKGADRVTDVFRVGLTYSVGNGGLDLDAFGIQYSGAFGSLKSLVAGTGKVRVRGLFCAYEFPKMTIAPSLNEIASGSAEGYATFAQTDWAEVATGYPPTIAAGEGRTGAAFKMVPNGSAWVGGKITKKVRPGQSVFFSAWYKLASLAGGANFVMSVKLLDVRGNVVSINDQLVLSGSAAWTYYTNVNLLHTPIPAGADSIEIQFRLESGAGTGTAWVDDVILNIID